MRAGDLRIDVPLGRRVDVRRRAPQAASFDAAADHQRGEVVGDQDVVEAVAEPTALEGAGPRPRVEGWEGVDLDQGPLGSTRVARLAAGWPRTAGPSLRSPMTTMWRSPAATRSSTMVRTPWAWRARLGPPPPDWLLKWFTSTHTVAPLSSRHWYWAQSRLNRCSPGRARVGDVDVAAHRQDLDLRGWS